MSDKKPVFSVLLAGILWGIITIFIKHLSAFGLDAMNISLIRMITAAPLFTLALAVTDKSKLKIKPKDIWIFIGTGVISVVLFNCLYFYTMINSQASIAVVLLYTSPVFVMILSAILFKEKITVKKVIALLLTFAGCIFTAGLLGGGYKISPIILLTGLGSGLCYALYSVFGRVALQKYSSNTVTAYTLIFGLIGSLFIGKPAETFKTVAQNPSLILWCLGIGIFCTVLPYFFYTAGLNKLESSKAAIIVAVEPLVGGVLGMTVYHEPHSAAKILGMALILSAIVLLNLPDKKPIRSRAADQQAKIQEE